MNKYRYGNFLGEDERQNRMANGMRIGLGIIIIISFIINIFLIQRDHKHLETLEKAQTQNVQDIDAFAGKIVNKLLDHDRRLNTQEGNIVFPSVVTGTHITATVSMYTSTKAETDDTPCIAASGKNICRLYEAGQNTCASNDIPLGTLLQVDGLGVCTVWDRMNARYTGKGRIDWYLGMDRKGAKKHGVKDYQVTIIR